MPWLNPGLLESVLYLYPSATDARDGTKAGGSGFFVSMPSEASSERRHFCAVTNKHVIDQGALVLRINTKDQRFETLNTSADRWETVYEDDLAVLALDLPPNVEVWAVPFDVPRGSRAGDGWHRSRR